MRAIIYDRFGPPEVLHEAELPRPVPATGEILVRVRATSVTTADWRLRAAAFPGVLWLPGHLIAGLFRPRHRVLGVDFAGEVAELGPGVTRFVPGDRVFGFSGRGGYAEYLTIKETAAVVPTPAALSDTEVAALPFGALCALVFLRDVAKVSPGQKVLIVGASGGVGCYAVQIARAMGARVTGVAGADRLEFLRDLGADRVIDYRTEDFSRGEGGYDLVFDTVGASDFSAARRVLTPGGLFLPLNFGLREMLQALWTRIAGGQRVSIGTNPDRAQDLEALKAMIAEGRLRPVIDGIYPLDRIVEAHRHVETRHRRGAVVISVA